MSTIRFVHTDHFRLATPLSGLANSPGWLQQLASNAVRQAVCNVIETAINRQAHFLLIGGSITDSQDDLQSVIQWLDEQFIALRDRGIKIVASAADGRTTESLRKICDLVIGRNEVLNVVASAGSQPRLTVTQVVESSSADLVVTIGHQSFHEDRMSYQAVPGVRPDEHRNRVSHRRHAAVTAGAVQSLNHREQWECRCAFVEADLSNDELRVESVPTAGLSFATETLTSGPTASPGDVIPRILRSSDILAAAESRTVIVDWELDASVVTDLNTVDQLSESNLLTELRNQLHSGHKGVWPRSVRFTPNSRLQLYSSAGEAAEEYFELQSGPLSCSEDTNNSQYPTVLRGTSGMPADLLTGLDLLRRTA